MFWLLHVYIEIFYRAELIWHMLEKNNESTFHLNDESSMVSLVFLKIKNILHKIVRFVFHWSYQHTAGPEKERKIEIHSSFNFVQ